MISAGTFERRYRGLLFLEDHGEHGGCGRDAIGALECFFSLLALAETHASVFHYKG
jgi:hypothetical protein